METTQNNILIAEFMGLKPTEIFGNWSIYKDHISVNGKVKEEVLENFCKHTKYHSDWNWLMEVVGKIESLGYTHSIFGNLSTFLKKGTFNTPIWDAEFKGNTKLEAVYNACVEFIKWYNTQNKNKTMTATQKNLHYILMPIFKGSDKLKKYIGSIINWGNVENDKITYITKNGNITEYISELGSNFILLKESDLGLKDSLYHWVKRDNYINQNKEFVIDNTITEGEIYTKYTWRVSMQILVTDTQVKCKLLKD